MVVIWLIRFLSWVVFDRNAILLHKEGLCEVNYCFDSILPTQATQKDTYGGVSVTVRNGLGCNESLAIAFK